MNICTKVLVGIPLETGQKQYTVDYKLETYLKIARLYLEDEDPVQGEAYINRAAQLQTQTKDDHLQIIYKVITNTKGPSINDVASIFALFDPPPSPCRLI